MIANWSMWANFVLIAATILLAAYAYLTRNFNYWKARGVPYIKPTPLFGNYYDCATFKKTIGHFLADLYNRMEGEPFFGIFVVDKPFLIVKSPELIKAILVKDFSHFTDRTILSNERDDPISAHMLFMSKNPEWKAMRSKLTPVFTSGKIKAMFPLIAEIGETLRDFMEKNALDRGPVEVKEICGKYTTDVIASCAFGISAKSFEEENAEFRSIARQFFEFTLANSFRQISHFFLPGLVRFFGMKLFSQRCTSFVRDVFRATVESREKSEARRNDLVDILLQMKRNGEFMPGVNFENDRIVAQAGQFFAAGFETTSSTMSFALYQLCINKEMQDRVRTEINNAIRKHGKLTYEAVQEMSYLHQCICEILRMYPVLPFLDRICLQDYKIPDSGYVIEKGTPVYIPMFGLHYDPKYFPNPEKFDPDRFSEENQSSRTPFSYVPFGEGPRVCIGERFGMLVTKVGLISVLSEFEVVRTEETPVPLIFETKSLFLASKDGLPMELKRATSIAA